jgi:hypothetical protein
MRTPSPPHVHGAAAAASDRLGLCIDPGRRAAAVVPVGHSAGVIALLVALAATSPWLVGIVFVWRQLPRDDYLPPSLADTLRARYELG